jgi:hypothetical protein
MQVGSYGYFVGSDSAVTFHAWKGLLLTAGYRTFNLHVRKLARLRAHALPGPYGGAGIRF